MNVYAFERNGEAVAPRCFINGFGLDSWRFSNLINKNVKSYGHIREERQK